MTANKFEPKKFIDREFEQELFESLLKFEAASRILAIKDSGGMGKSHLLEKFQYRCRTIKPRTPISLVVLDQLPDYSPLTLVKIIAEHLSAFNLKFDNYTKYENARQSANFNLISSSIYLQSANFAGAQDINIAGTIVEGANQVSISAGALTLTPDQEKTAREVVVNSFFDDLLAHCNKQPVVLMFDSFERCEQSLQNWITDYLLEHYFFSCTPPLSRLILLIAGRDLPAFDMKWSEEDCASLVKSIDELKKWKKIHVEECLRVHGFIYEAEDIDAFYRLIERGMPPSAVIQAMQTCLRTK